MLALARHTLLRLIRRRTWQLAAFVALILPIIYYLGFQGFARFSIPIDALSHPAGLANFLAMIIAAYLGVTALAEDKRLGLTELLMTKPLSPWQYIAGRMLGCLTMLLALWIGISLTILASAALFHQGPFFHLAITLALAFLGQAMVFSLGFLFSQWISPLIAGILVLLLNDRVFYSFAINIDQSPSPAAIKYIGQFLAKAFYYLVPQVSELTLWGTVNYFYLIDPARAALAVLYSISYVLLMFAIAVHVFQRSKWDK